MMSLLNFHIHHTIDLPHFWTGTRRFHKTLRAAAEADYLAVDLAEEEDDIHWPGEQLASVMRIPREWQTLGQHQLELQLFFFYLFFFFVFFFWFFSHQFVFFFYILPGWFNAHTHHTHKWHSDDTHTQHSVWLLTTTLGHIPILK